MIFVSGQEGRERKNKNKKLGFLLTHLCVDFFVREELPPVLCERFLARLIGFLHIVAQVQCFLSLSFTASSSVSEAREFRKKKRRRENLKLISTFSRRYFGDRGLFSRFGMETHTTGLFLLPHNSFSFSYSTRKDSRSVFPFFVLL